MDKSRQQFEEWRSKNKSSTINLFDVWQASRESLINNLEPVGYMRLEGGDNIKEYGFTHIYEEKFDKETIPLYRLDK